MNGETKTAKRGSPLYFQQLFDELRTSEQASVGAPVWEAAVVPTCDWFTQIVLSETMLSDHDKSTYDEAVSAVLGRME